MPFGLANAGSVYSRMLDVAMDKVERDFWTSYLDDILTFSTKPRIHFGHLSQVVRVHAAAGIKIQPCKSKLFQSEVEYLGHKISRKGVEMILDYVHKVMAWPVPTSGKEVATFLGFAGYYRSFIPQYSALTNRLNGIKKAEKFVWNEEIEKDFVQLKEAFTHGGVQVFPDFGIADPFILTTDWSQDNIAGVLSQVQDGEERFLGCWGRKCNKYERNYPSYKGELLAVIQCIKKWKHILNYLHFEVHTDSSALNT